MSMPDIQQKLEHIALGELERTAGELPPELAREAARVPVTLQNVPNRAQREEGIEPDTLGLFVGPEFAFEQNSNSPLPPQIILFLQNLWAEAEHDEQQFKAEVRTTYLHELGHYLGLDEEGLIERGLE